MSLFIKQARELYNSTFSTANLKKYSNEDINIQLEGSARIDEYYKSVFILLSKEFYPESIYLIRTIEKLWMLLKPILLWK